jgi:Spy/CpxP family protein refolding chaperone
MTARGRLVVAVAAVALAAAPARAQSQRDLYERMLPPELVLAHADALGLGPAERAAVRRVHSEMQPLLPPLLRRMREELDALVALIETARPEEPAVLARFERLNAVETELKRVRLRMTVAVKKVLTPEQQQKALALQGRRVGGHARGAGPDSLAGRLQRVKEGIERWKREGRDVTRLRALWDRFREAEERGHYRQARQALDEALALLDGPPHR